MNWRHELKFVIDESTFQRLYFTLRPILHGDRHALNGSDSPFSGYLIRSLYFDDHARTGVFDKLAGVDPRHKYRIRIYNDNDSVIHLEKKIKRGQMTRKVACRLDRPLVDSILDGQPEAILDFADNLSGLATARARQSARDLLLQFYADIRIRLLRPLLLVDYERTPFVWPDGNVRITFDRHLTTGIYRQDLWDPDGAMIPVLDAGQLVMEVKYDRFLPDFIQQILKLDGAHPLAVSKYVQCAGTCRQQPWEDQL